jgi:hypothetical protein
MWPMFRQLQRMRQPFVHVEGFMAKRDFQQGISRRSLLGSTAAITATAIVPPEAAAAAVVTELKTPAVNPPPAALNVCAATARRLAEIARRNELRREAGLPLLRIAGELRRMKELEGSQAFETFAEAHRKEAWEQVLGERRKPEDNPNWRPNWAEGVYYQNQAYWILREQFWAAGHCAG